MGDNAKAVYFKFESFGSVDGPGVRSIIFLSGCPYRCLYCHNPENYASQGKEITAKDAFDMLKKYKPYWRNNGGITVSGGEPLLQTEFVTELFKLAKQAGFNTCVDTAGGNFVKTEPFFGSFNKMLEYTDLILMDLKAPNDDLHMQITGQNFYNSKNMFLYLDKINFPIWVRYVLVPGFTDGKETLEEAATFIKSLGNVKKTEILPYHTFALPKYEELAIPYPLKGVPTPDKNAVAAAKSIFDNILNS